MRKIFASLALATALAIPTVITAAPATARPTNTNHTDITYTNWDTFKAGKGTNFVIKVRAAACNNCKGLNGKAQVKLDGNHHQWKTLDKGNVTFRVPRSALRNNHWVQVAVRTWPDLNSRPSKVVKFNVRDVPKAKSTNRGSKIVKAARSQVGDRYRLGANGPNVWDCSSLTRYAVKKGTGKTIPRTSSAQRNIGQRVGSPKPGDLVSTPGHIAVYSGGGKIVEAATPSTGVVERRMWQRGAVYIRP